MTTWSGSVKQNTNTHLYNDLSPNLSRPLQLPSPLPALPPFCIFLPFLKSFMEFFQLNATLCAFKRLRHKAFHRAEREVKSRASDFIVCLTSIGVHLPSDPVRHVRWHLVNGILPRAVFNWSQKLMKHHKCFAKGFLNG